MADSFLKGHAFEVKTMAREFLDIAMGTEKGPVDNAEMTEVLFECRGGGSRGMGWAVPATVLPLSQSRCQPAARPPPPDPRHASRPSRYNVAQHAYVHACK